MLGFPPKSFFSLVFVILLVLLPNWTLADTSLTSQELPPYKVGVITPLSGDFASFGTGIMQAIQLANDVEPGRKLQLFVEDNRTCLTPEAVKAFHKLKSVDQVEAIVTVCSAAAQGVLPLSQKSGLPLLQITESGPDPQNYLIKLMPEIAPATKLLAKHFASIYPKMAVIGDRQPANAGDSGNLAVFGRAFEESGGEIVLKEEFDGDVTDLLSLIERIKKSGADAVIPFIGSANQMNLFLRQAEQLRLWSTVKLAGNFTFEFLLAELTTLDSSFQSRWQGLESANLSRSTALGFIESFRKRFGSEPVQFADYAYDAALILKRCSGDRSCHLQKFEGASGVVQFESNGLRVGSYELKRLRDSGFVKE